MYRKNKMIAHPYTYSKSINASVLPIHYIDKLKEVSATYLNMFSSLNHVSSFRSIVKALTLVMAISTLPLPVNITSS